MNPESWIDLAKTVCAHAGVGYKSVETIATWNEYACANTIFHLNDQWYLKVFGPDAQRQFHVERTLLQTLENFNEIPAPRIVAQGESDEIPPYLILSEIPGSTAEQVWDTLSRSEQLALARNLGEITAAIHRLPQSELTAVEQQFGGWQAHLAAQQSRRIPLIEATETVPWQQRRDVVRFLREEAPKLLENSLQVCHCELAHNHIYLLQERNSWQVSGFIDWADGMIGPPEWDVAFLWFWTFSRDREAMRVCLQALYADNPPPERLARRCLAAILHTHSMPALWAEFAEQENSRNPVEYEMTQFLFPTDLFGSPD